MSVKVAFSKNYFRDVKALNEDERFQLEDLLNRIRFKRVSSGDRREHIKCQSGYNVFSYRVNQDVRLAVYEWRPKEFLAIACDHHDELYNRVKRMQLTNIGQAQLPIAVEPDIDIKEAKESCGSEERKTVFENGLIKLSVEQVTQLGVSIDVAERLRSAETEDALIALVQDVESAAMRDALLDIAIDPSVYEKKKEALAREDVPRLSVDSILRRSFADRENYYILTEDKYELYFNGKLENWQVFLHPDQTRAVEMEANGPMMITGPAGTGKSVVAVHRVKWLLTHRYKVKGHILLTTFTHTLAEYARELLKNICTAEEMRRVEVTHFDHYVQSLIGANLRGVRILYGDIDFRKETPFIKVVLDACQRSNFRGRTPAFIAEEYDRVIAENDIHTLDQYKSVTRPKDLGRLSVENRTQLSPILSDIASRMRLEKQLPRSVAINRLIDVVGPNNCPFESIVVDEAQDLGAPEYRLLAKLTGNTYDNAVPFSLCFAGDGHQRIYNRAGSLKQCGINVKGRSIHLIKCYRSTKKIREYAEKIIKDVQVKDMDAEVDVLAGSESLIEGVSPEIRFANSEDEKFNIMASLINKWLSAGGKLGDCAVLVRSNRQLDKVVAGLSIRRLTAVRIDRETVDFDSGSIKVMTMHRAKGLQFVNVVVDVDKWPQRGVKKADDAEISSELLAKEKCLLYMSVMRAMNNVLITSSRGVNPHVPSDQVLL